MPSFPEAAARLLNEIHYVLLDICRINNWPLTLYAGSSYYPVLSFLKLNSDYKHKEPLHRAICITKLYVVDG